MNEIVPFDFKNNEIRTLEINGVPWFVALDVCAALGINNTTNAVKPIPDRHKTLYRLKGMRGSRGINCVSETGVYLLLTISQKREAREFMLWVCEEVLPSIRKTGSYSIPVVEPVAKVDHESALKMSIDKLSSTIENLARTVTPVIEFKPEVQNDVPGIADEDLMRSECLTMVQSIASIRVCQAQDVWNAAYAKLNRECHCNIKSVKSKGKHPTIIDAVVATGRIAKLHKLSKDFL